MTTYQIRLDDIGDYAVLVKNTNMYRWVFATTKAGIEEELLYMNREANCSLLLNESELVFEGSKEECIKYILMDRLLKVGA